MTTETVTVLFTDLVGSTELLSRAGEPAADELRREHFGLLRTAIAAHGGREIKNLGDGLMVVFGGVISGVACATMMQQEIAARSPNAEPLAIRIGVAVGEAEADDGDYFGLPVVEAARLCAHADSGDILTTDLVRTLVRSRGGFELQRLGGLELKGLDEPVEAFRVLWSPMARELTGPPLPTRLVSARSSSFAGRHAERERLASVWKAVAAGDRRLMFLTGEPGIGKTALAAQCASDAQDAGGLVVYGRSDEELGVSYQPWMEALGQLIDLLPDELLVEHVADRGAHVGRLVPRLATRTQSEVPAATDAETERFVLFGCVTDLLARASSEQPMLVVLDDLHWADRPTGQLLRHIVTADEQIRVEVLGTFRDTDVSPGDPVADLLAALHREVGVERIALRGLGDEELLELLERIAGHDMDEQGVALRDALLAETDGNPFFVDAILRHLAETGAIYQRDGRWVAAVDLREMRLPMSVREVIGRRLATLGPDTERVLTVAAVIGRDFDLHLLGTIAHIDQDSLIDLCDAAVTAAVLDITETPDRYTFSHALIEHALYDNLSPARRVRVHGAVAEALEARFGVDPGDRAGELAFHWAAAVLPADTSKAIHYAQVAGQRALDQLAPDEALRWYTQALELLGAHGGDDQRQRAELLVGLGDAQRQCGVADYRRTLLGAARLADRIDAVDLLVRAALENNRGWYSGVGEVDDERIAVIDRALERLEAHDTPAHARLLAVRLSEGMWASDGERLDHAIDAIEVARRTDDPAVLADTLRRAAFATSVPWTLEQRTSWIDEACGLADEHADAGVRVLAHRDAMVISLERGDREAVRRNSRAYEDEARRVPLAAHRWTSGYQQVVPALLDGDLTEAERLADAALAYGMETGQPDAIGIYGPQLINIREHQGRYGEVIPLIEQAVRDAPALVAYQAALAYALARDGNVERASSLLDDQAAAGLQTPADIAWSTAQACWAGAAFCSGHLATALAVRDRIAPFHDQVVTTGVTVHPALAHFLGLLDHLTRRLDEADAWFREAMDLHQQLRSPLLVACTRAAWAGLLADRARDDDGRHARALARQALAISTVNGYGYVEADARAVLSRTA